MTLIHRLRTALAAVLLPSALLSPASMAAQPSLFPPPAACDPTKQSCVPGPTPGPTPPPSCGPGPGGAPCGGGGPASQGNTSGTSQGAGNPLNVINGNKYQQEVDMPALPGVLGLELVRHYNSAWRSLGQSGYGWRLSYETDLFVVRNTVQIRQADGTELIFNRDPNNPSTCHSANPADGRILIKATPRGEEFVWLWANGRRLAFDSRGKLESITAPTGEFVTLQHGPKGELLKVTDPQGRSLSLEWGSPKAPGFQGIVAIQTPLGRFVLHHNGDAKHPGLGNLMAVSAPQGSTRRYHYGADAGEANPSLPHHLTGISLESLDAKGKVASQRLNTWAYDVNGRGILSARGLPRQTGPDGQTQAGTGIEQVNLDFSSPGKTILTNSLGQTTSYRHAIVGNSFRLLEVRGAGCASCGEVNLRYGYDRLGRLTEQTTLNQLGQPLRSTRTDLDGLGRAVRVSSVNYVSSTGAGLAKPQAPQLLVRYEYAGEGMQPTLIARPSVISQPGATSGAGKEHQTRIVYNPAGQPLSVTESGFSPLDEQGQPLNLAGAKAATTEAERASPISRSTAYKYQLINGRSVLAEIDGPLQNGAKGTPEDSDITRFDYDQRANHLQVITQPGKLKSSVTYDAAGRIATVRNAQGFKTSFTLDARSQPTQISSSGPGWAQPQVQSFQYNALGQPTESGHGSPTGQNYQPQLAQGFDAFGRKLWSASALGMLEHNRFDTESRLIETGLHSNRMAQVQRYAYDSLGRLTQASDSSGASITLAYDAQGDLQTATDALGRVRSLASTVPTQAGSTARLAELPHTARQLRDDFGRIVATISPDAGSTTRSFDAADRLIASSDAQGHRAAYAHDVQGRIQRQTILDAGSKQALVTLWQYQGQQLIALEHPTQSERYAYDARGLRVSRIVTLKTANGGEHRAVTRYHHDDSGTLQSASLPDGSQIIYERNGQGQITALKRSALQSAWLRSHASWLAPAQTIVQDLQRDIVGLSRYTAGNGIQASFQRSEQGVLARVLYRNTKRVETATPMQTAASASWPILLGRSTQDTISLLLGVGSAHAAPASQGAGPTQGGAAPVNTASVKLPGALGLAPDPQALIDQRLLWDAQGNLLHKQDRTSANTARDASYASYAYDGQDRLIVATQTPGKRETPAVSVATTGSAMDRPGSHTSRYFYQAGRRLLSQENVADQSDLSAHTRKAAYQRNTHRWLGDSANSQPARYNANGQPNSVGQREYVWDALGRLLQVRQENQDLAQYRYSHRGERIAKTVAGKTTHYLYHEAGQISAELDEQGRITRQYLYLAEQPIAVIDTPEGVLLSNQELSAPTQLAQDAAFILKNLWRSVSGGGAEQWAWLHPNHLGAPEAATNAQGQVLWQASYAAFGAARVVGFAKASGSPGKTSFTLNLRLPGQYQDSETGLHYNRHRYYDPSRGEYLTPDPLGTPDGPNPYAYVRYNPLKYIDPEGLILFAFDGTNNSNSPPGQDTVSNVYKFYLAYDISPTSANGDRAWYMNGIGRDDPDSGISTNWTDAVNANTGRARVDYMLAQLDDYIDKRDMSDGKIISLDMIGFSRGAALARDFANRVATRLRDKTWGDKTACVEIRFMGLWDTVAQFGVNGAGNGAWQLAIPPEAKSVFQAVAMNENRYLFPGESIGRGTQRGFVGSHADIGGSYGTGDLSDVALNWIAEQAKSSGVTMLNWGQGDTNMEWGVVTNPVVHDASNGTENSAFCLRDNNEVWADRCSSRRTATPGGLTAAQIADLRFIVNRATPGLDADGSTPITGDVDMKEYAKWLKANYGLNIAVGP